MGIFTQLAGARSAWLTGQQQGQQDRQAQVEAERLRTQQDEDRFSAKAQALLQQKLVEAQMRAQDALTAERMRPPEPKPVPKWQPTTQEEAVAYEGKVAEARAAAEAKHRRPEKPGRGDGPSGEGQQSYNNQFVRDDRTGQTLIVDPRTGQTKGVVQAPDGSAVRDIPQAVRQQVDGIDGVLQSLANLERELRAVGPQWGTSAARARLKAAYTAAQLDFKEAAALGALAGPDLDLIQGALQDPTDRKGILSGQVTQESALGTLQQVREQFTQRRARLGERYGMASKGDVTLPDPAAADFQQAADLYKQALSEGVDPKAARRAYDAAIFRISKQHGKVR